MVDWLLIIIYGFIDDKNKEKLKQENLQGLLMRTEEHSEHCCTIGGYNWM